MTAGKDLINSRSLAWDMMHLHGWTRRTIENMSLERENQCVMQPESDVGVPRSGAGRQAKARQNHSAGDRDVQRFRPPEFRNRNSHIRFPYDRGAYSMGFVPEYEHALFGESPRRKLRFPRGSRDEYLIPEVLCEPERLEQVDFRENRQVKNRPHRRSGHLRAGELDTVPVDQDTIDAEPV